MLRRHILATQLRKNGAVGLTDGMSVRDKNLPSKMLAFWEKSDATMEEERVRYKRNIDDLKVALSKRKGQRYHILRESLTLPPRD